MGCPAAARLTDIWEGICCCHPPIPCIAMSGPIITASPDVHACKLEQARLTDITIGSCGHTGVIVTSSELVHADCLGKARIGDEVDGCNIGVIVTGCEEVLVAP